MPKTTSSRVRSLVFGAGVAAALAFGATAAVAAPDSDTGQQFFCGFYASLESCDQCCGGYQASWEGIECWCGPDTKW